jgi:hypothetical protein
MSDPQRVVTGDRIYPRSLRRHNIAPDPPDGFVDITDVSRMTGLFGSSCEPQPRLRPQAPVVGRILPKNGKRILDFKY